MSEFEQKILEKLDGIEKKIENEVTSLASATQMQFEAIQRQLDYSRREIREELVHHHEKLDSRLNGLQNRIDVLDDMTRSHTH